MSDNPQSDRSPESEEAGSLILRHFAGELSDAQTHTLRELLRTDPAVREMFVSYSLQRCSLRVMLKRDRDLRDEANAAPDDELTDAMIGHQAIRDRGQTQHAARTQAGEIADPDLATFNEAGAGVTHDDAIQMPKARMSLPLRWWGGIAALVVLGLVLFAVFRDRPVGMLLTQRDATWENASPETGRAVKEGQTLTLSSGYAEFSLDNGATILMEAPSQLTFVSMSTVSLQVGKVVGKKAGGGLVINTPTSTITDLGTEFGVEVRSDGSTRVEVFTGKVRVNGVSTDASQGTSNGQILTQGKAANVTANGVTLDPAGPTAQTFVRQLVPPIAQQLDVIDMMNGGDGTTNRKGIGVSTLTGEPVTTSYLPDIAGDGKYHPVKDIPIVDGCFIPNGEKGPERISTAGTTFLFPKTSNGSYNHIWTVWPAPGASTADSTLNGIDYSKPGHAILLLHANAGITLDLAKVRRLHPGATVKRLSGVVGNFNQTTSKADVMVLVDGKVVMQRMRFSGPEGAIPVDVPLNAQNRFVTLVSMDGGDLFHQDWVAWCDIKIAVGGE